ncbi:hypothetical protein DFH06DRAFT_283647 [Mycena polygramma]|nr:hypothetical protein DFH06DRAFT_283647 [Mycena polygramma]
MVAPVLALAFGSYGDIVEAIKEAKAIIDLLRGVGKGSHEREAISREWTSVIATAEQLLLHLNKFPVPSPEYTTLLNKVASEIVPFGSGILKQVHDCILWWQGANMFQKLRAAVSEREELDKWRHYIDRFRSELTGLSTILTLICSAAQSAQLQGQMTSQSTEITRNFNEANRRFDTLVSQITSCLSLQQAEMNSRLDAQLSETLRLTNTCLPMGITPNAFYIMDPTGAVGIPFPLQYFRGFETLHHLLVTYLGADNAGSQHVLRGDYSLVDETGAHVSLHALGRTVRLNRVFRISIIKRVRAGTWWHTKSPYTCRKCGTRTLTSDAEWSCSRYTQCGGCGYKFQVSNYEFHNAARQEIAPSLRELPHISWMTGRNSDQTSFPLERIKRVPSAGSARMISVSRTETFWPCEYVPEEEDQDCPGPME